MKKKNLKWLTMALAMMMALILSVPDVALAAPRVQLSQTRAAIDLAATNKLTLTASASGVASSAIVWRSKNSAIASVSGGVVTAKKVGKVQIGARVKGGAWSVCTVTITDSRAPKSLILSAAAITIARGETASITATLSPTNAAQSVTWLSNKPAVATVSKDGVITGIKPGNAIIRATSTRNTALKKTVRVTVTAATVPTRLTISPDTTQMDIGDKLTLNVDASPSDASAKVKWTTSNAAIATVSAAGVVTAKKAGKVTITATSAVKSTVRATRAITVADPNAVTGINIGESDFYLDVGKAVNLTVQIQPSSSKAKVTWASSNTSVAAVTTDGKVVGRAAGTATIRATAGNKSDDVEVRVLSTDRETTLPSRYVDSASAIDANHKKINNVFQSAIQELEMHVAKKNIDSKERANRKTIIQRGFLMYDVPWSTSTTVRYWSGSTNYVANRIYFGMPYTQINRTYNLEKWLKVVNYTKTNGYHAVTGMPNTTYPGNDCSSFVSICNWGTDTAYSYLNSTAMYSSAKYTTVSNGFSSLIPGDILVKNGHVAMFLYYVTSDRIMVLEQGGSSEPNTVSVNLKTISGTYSPQGYRVRRRVDIAG